MTDIATLRQAARDAFLVGVAAADPAAGLQAALDARPPLPPKSGRLIIIALGKAALRMVETALGAAPEGVEVQALAVTNYENARQVKGVEVIASAHPIPDENGLKAGARIMELLKSASERDLILCLISGGGSALCPAPAPGLSLADKIAVNDMLLASGLDIGDMNLVRQNLSALKGGGMLRLAALAEIRSYILSDVLGDDLRVVASGPSVSPIGGPAEAIELLTNKGLLGDLPEAARQCLLSAPELGETPKPDATMIGGNGISLAAMADAANAKPSPGDLIGDVQDAAERIVAEAIAAGPGARLAFGGETTVKLTGSGKGGRNQELTLRVAEEAARVGLPGAWVFLSGGTDGRDGPTEAAGGIVDSGSLGRLAAAGFDIDVVLQYNDSFPALKAANDLLDIGASGTNVADLQLMFRA